MGAPFLGSCKRFLLFIENIFPLSCLPFLILYSFLPFVISLIVSPLPHNYRLGPAGDCLSRNDALSSSPDVESSLRRMGEGERLRSLDLSGFTLTTSALLRFRQDDGARCGFTNQQRLAS